MNISPSQEKKMMSLTGKKSAFSATDWCSADAGLRLSTFSPLLAMVLSTTCGRIMWQTVSNLSKTIGLASQSLSVLLLYLFHLLVHLHLLLVRMPWALDDFKMPTSPMLHLQSQPVPSGQWTLM